MNKILLTFLIMAFPAFSSFAQIKVGLRVAPGIGLTNVSDKISSDAIAYSKGSNSISFSIGPTIDFFLNNNIAFCTGLWWSTRKISIQEQPQAQPILTASYTSSLQYIQIPVSFKVYSNEITNGLKIYGQLGGLIETKISDKLKSSFPDLTLAPGYTYEKWYQYANLGLYSSAGVDYSFHNESAVYLGVFYQRGLINQARNFKYSNGLHSHFNTQAKVALSSIGLELGFKF